MDYDETLAAVEGFLGMRVHLLLSSSDEEQSRMLAAFSGILVSGGSEELWQQVRARWPGWFDDETEGHSFHVEAVPDMPEPTPTFWMNRPTFISGWWRDTGTALWRQGPTLNTGIAGCRITLWSAESHEVR